MNRADLERHAARWRARRTLARALVSLAVALLLAATFDRAVPAFAVALLGGAATWLALRRRTPRLDAAALAAHLDRTHPTLEESASLWLRPAESLELAARLQLRRLDAAWHALPDRDRRVSPPARHLRRAALACAFSLAVFAGALAWRRPTPPPAVATPAPIAVPQRVPPALVSGSLVIEPPAYLGRPPRRLTALDGEAEEGSALAWEIAVAGDVRAVALHPAGGAAPIAATPLSPGRFAARARLSDTLLYQLALVDAAGTRTLLPAVHTLKALRDQPPRLAWLEPATARTVVDPASVTAQSVRLAVTDDHGVADARLVVTVAKGSGEGVKFRERPWPLVPAADGTTFSAQLAFADLQLEPGDELYLFAEAADRREPEPNRARSETRFVVLRGPAAELADPGVALRGVNRVPQYFRSQRQLIIDTERLLAEQPALAAEKFRARSEDIGLDQKLLRLRYGQFLGEELEPDAGGAPAEARAMSLAARLQGRDPESAARAAAVERAVEAQHRHDENARPTDRPATLEDLRAPFVHNHDSPEAATIFDPALKASLRAVIAAMWEAEGFLRTGRPADALPHEHRALELLKELQQADRVYVKRVGFEPAPLKVDERRLRGELDAIPKTALSAVPLPARRDEIAALHAALAQLDRDGPAAPEVGAHVDAQLTAAAQREPERFVLALELWRRSGPRTAAESATLRAALWSLLPAAQAAPQTSPEPAPALARKYFEALAPATR